MAVSTKWTLRSRHGRPSLSSFALFFFTAASLLLRSASFALSTFSMRPMMSSVRDSLVSPQKALQKQALVQSLLGE